ncbi:MAG: hypothetical protein E7289_10370 [Lachnospiraceae bacterium]|nr:hypothetical protein [Lachnospiraceae bacterium]
MEDQKIYLVGGIAFTDIKQAKLAQIEQKRIEILDEKLNYNDIEAVANVYKKARDNRTFQTPVGITYMLRLYDWLIKNNYEGVDKMYVIMEQEPDKANVDNLENGLLTERDELWKSRLENQKKKEWVLSNKLRTSLWVNAVLVVLVILLFVISQTGNNPTILNYKTKIINQYSAWEQELEQREQAVEEKEAELGIMYESTVSE